jgi:predicted molibdopterin-dependent oxidoreductase YjgC
LDIECSLEEILEADCILVVGADPVKTHPVVGSLMRRAVTRGGAKLIVIDPVRDVFPLFTELWLKPKAGTEKVLLNGLANIAIEKSFAKREGVGEELLRSVKQIRIKKQREIGKVCRATGIGKGELESAAAMYGEAERGIIIYGEGLLEQGNPNLVTSLLNLAHLTGNLAGDRLRVVSLKPNANSRGAWELGIAAKNGFQVKDLKGDKVKGVYLLLADEEKEDEELLSQLEGLGFLVVQASYHSPATSIADVVLPSPIWAEREGKYTSLDGHSLRAPKVLQPKEGSLQDWEILVELSRRLGHELSYTREADCG